MSSFAGLIAFDGEPISRPREQALANAVAGHHRRIHIQRTARAIFIHTQAPERSADDVLFAACSWLDNRSEIAATTGADRLESENGCIRRIFEAQGSAGIARLLGAFAFAHWNEASGTLTLARDCLGRRSLFYHAGKGFVAFASNIAALMSLPEVPRDLDERMLANFLALNHREHETTFYRGIVRVPSRSVVRITRDAIDRRRYWGPDLGTPPYGNDTDYIVRARELFERAVARALRDTPRVALSLSGGLDSAALAATLAKLGIVPIECYTGLSPPNLDRQPRDGWYLDERTKVEALARAHPSLRTTFITPRGAHLRQSDPARFFPAIPLPHRNLANLGWFAQIEEAIRADGHQVVLSGGMGNLTTSWDGRFSLAALLGEGRVSRTLAHAQAIARSTERNTARVLASEAVMPLLPAAAQRMIARLRGRPPEDIAGISLLRREVVAELDLPRQWREDRFDPAFRPQGNSARQRAHQIFDQNQLSRDIAGMRFDAEGLDARDPYGDRELVEFCLSVPETLFRRNGVKRWFARQVFADRLPREILDERGTGEQAANWFESLDARRPIIVAEAERLENSRLARRLIDLPRLNRLIAEWPKSTAEAQLRMAEYRYALDRAVHVGQFIRWVEGGNA